MANEIRVCSQVVSEQIESWFKLQPNLETALLEITSQRKFLENDQKSYETRQALDRVITTYLTWEEVDKATQAFLRNIQTTIGFLKDSQQQMGQLKSFSKIGFCPQQVTTCANKIDSLIQKMGLFIQKLSPRATLLHQELARATTFLGYISYQVQSSEDTASRFSSYQAHLQTELDQKRSSSNLQLETPSKIPNPTSPATSDIAEEAAQLTVLEEQLEKILSEPIMRDFTSFLEETIQQEISRALATERGLNVASLFEEESDDETPDFPIPAQQNGPPVFKEQSEEQSDDEMPDFPTLPQQNRQSPSPMLRRGENPVRPGRGRGHKKS